MSARATWLRVAIAPHRANRAPQRGKKKARSKTRAMGIAARLSAKQRDELEALMDARNPDGLLAATITRLHGFLTSVVSGPMVVPSEWMPVVFGSSDDRAWERWTKPAMP